MKIFIALALVATAAAQFSSEYLPPVSGGFDGGFDGGVSYDVGASAPITSYLAPAASFETYDVAGSAPAHSFSGDDGYRYKTQRRRVVKTSRRHRREVSTEYLPPVASFSAGADFGVAASAPAVSYSAPAVSYAAPAVSYAAPAVSYAVPAASYESYEVEGSAPAHSFSDADGYRYKTNRRRVVKTSRRHRY